MGDIAFCGRHFVQVIFRVSGLMASRCPSPHPISGTGGAEEGGDQHPAAHLPLTAAQREVKRREEDSEPMPWGHRLCIFKLSITSDRDNLVETAQFRGKSANLVDLRHKWRIYGNFREFTPKLDELYGIWRSENVDWSNRFPALHVTHLGKDG